MCYYSAMSARGSEQKVISVSKYLNFQISFWDFGSKKDLILKAGFFSSINVDFNAKPCISSKYKTYSAELYKNLPKYTKTRNFCWNLRLEGQLFGNEILTFQEFITGKYPYLSTLTDFLYSWDGMAGRSQVILQTVHAFKKEHILWSCGNSLKSIRCSTQEYKLRFSKTEARVATCLYLYQHKEMSQL